MNESTTEVERIKRAVLNLPPSELDAFRRSYEAFEARRWDDQLRDDIESGRLEAVAREALADYEAGRCTEL